MSLMFDDWSNVSGDTLSTATVDDDQRAPASPSVSVSGVTSNSRYYRGDSANVSRLLDSLLGGYDKRLRPNYGGK